MPEAEIARREKSAGSRYAILHSDGGLDLVRRLRDTALAAVEPDRNNNALVVALDDFDPAVRYWGIVGLSHLQDDREAYRSQVIKGATGQPPVVQAAAGYFLVLSGAVENGLAKLKECLHDPSPWVRLEAATFAEQLGEQALPLIEDLKQAARGDANEVNGNRYPIAVAKHALERLGQK
jgi:HEAT repeat protein